jgi:hypothetical protein
VLVSTKILPKRHQKAKLTVVDAAGKEQRITSGASIVLKNVFPFLKLELKGLRS